MDTIIKHRENWSGYLLINWKYKANERLAGVVAVHETRHNYVITREILEGTDILVIPIDQVNHLNITMDSSG